MELGFFITGTDTNVGKTWACVALLHYFRRIEKSIFALKPVASGCALQNGYLLNEDALMLQEHATIKLPYQIVNPFAYELPISPHIAGQANPVDFDIILESFSNIKALAQVVLIEGAGGWYSPLNDHQDNSDLAQLFNLPVILVVAIKLGCINHARLTFGAIVNKGLRCAGWIAVNSDSSQLYQDAIVKTLTNDLKCPHLGCLPFMPSPDFDEMSKSLIFKD